MLIPTVKINTQCWHCGYKMTHVTNADPSELTRVPSNGDVTMCIECGSFAIFDDSFPDRIRKPNPAENFDLQRNETLQKARAVLWNIKHLVAKAAKED